MEEEKRENIEETIDNAYDDIEEVTEDKDSKEDEDTSPVVEETPSCEPKDEEDTPHKKTRKELKAEKAAAKADAKANKKKMKKSTRIAIIVTAVILSIVIIAVAIAVPIAIANKDKIFVSKPEDFASTDGKYFVLNDNITIEGDLELGSLNNIDFNGKSLTVTGTLKINDANSDAVLIGSIKNVDKKVDGRLNAGKIVISSSSDVNFNVIVNSGDLVIKAKNVKFVNSANISDKAEIEATSLKIEDNFIFSDITKSCTLDIKNADSVVIDGSVSGSIKMTNEAANPDNGYKSSVTINGDVTGDILADDKAYIRINSKVGGVVSSINNDTMIGKIALLENSFVKEINNASIVYVHVNAIYPNMNNVEKTDFIRPLERVGYISINDDTDDIFLIFPKVEGADKYIVTIDDGAPTIITKNEDGTYQGAIKAGTEEIMVPVTASENEISMSITENVKDVNKHIIKVQAASIDEELLLPSPVLSYEYMTYTTLNRASNIAININEEGHAILTFDRVNFADEYKITVNGKEFKTKDTTYDLHEYLVNGGSYVVQIIATSRNDNILDSKPSMYQYNYVIGLEAPVLTIGNTDKNLVLNWTQVTGAKYYEIVMLTPNPALEVATAEDEGVIDGEGPTEGEVSPAPEDNIPPYIETILYRTSGLTYETPLYDGSHSLIKKGQKFLIRAVSDSPYYNATDSNIVEYEFRPVVA